MCDVTMAWLQIAASNSMQGLSCVTPLPLHLPPPPLLLLLLQEANKAKEPPPPVFDDSSAAAAGAAGGSSTGACSSLESMYFTAPQQLLQVRQPGFGCAAIASA
jgi:hypothetical protein